MTMTLESVRKWHLDCAVVYERSGESALADQHRNLAASITAHLSQPAQAVDVGAIEAVIRELCKWPKEETFYDHRATRLACAEKLRVLSTAQAEVRGVEGWLEGAPPFPWSEEWFIAVLANGDRVVLRALPKEYTYDFKTADDTYIRRDLITKWMQFPDSDFIPATPAPDKEGK